MAYSVYSLMSAVNSEPKTYIVDLTQLFDITNYASNEELKAVINEAQLLSEHLTRDGNVVLKSTSLMAIPNGDSSRVITIKDIKESLAKKSAEEKRNSQN